MKSDRAAIALAEEYSFVYAAVGIHPEELQAPPRAIPRSSASLPRTKKCAAIGEIGLDYYWDASRREEQKELFAKRL